MNGLFGIGVGNFFKQSADLNFDAEFFAKFAHKAFLESLVWFAFAAGKFPKAAEMRVRMAPGDEQFAVAEDERGADFNDK